MNLPRRRLGRTNLSVPALGLGGAPLGSGDEAEAVATVHAALEAGIDLIDTSPLYGQSEERIGKALRGVPRTAFLLSTKTGTHPERRGDYSWDGTLWSVENSLRLLGVEYLDLCLVHDPGDMAAVYAPRGALEALEHLKALGVVRNIGLGQRNLDWHAQAVRSGRFDAVLTYNDFHPLRTAAADLLALAAQRDVGVLNGSPLGFGLMTLDTRTDAFARRFAGQPRDRDAARRLQAFCDERGVSRIAAALQFCLREPRIGVTLTGARTPEELRFNCEAAETPLPEAFWDDLAARGLRD